MVEKSIIKFLCLISITDCVGRPCLETRKDMTGLYETILDIVTPQSSADERRRTETYRVCQSLDSLQEKLASKGFHVKRSTLHYRLLPSNVKTINGKRHVQSKPLPIKLVNPRNEKRKAHADRNFAKAVVEMVSKIYV